MEKYTIKLRQETFYENITLTDVIYGSWLAVNIGTAPVTIFGIELAPTERLASKDIADMKPGDIWEEPIPIVIQTGGAVRMLRTIAKPFVNGVGRKK